MELSDAERTRLKEQKRREVGCRRGWSFLLRLKEEEQREMVERGEEGVYFKAEPAGNSRLGCGGVSVSRTACFCTRENPFVPNQ